MSGKQKIFKQTKTEVGRNKSDKNFQNKPKKSSKGKKETLEAKENKPDRIFLHWPSREKAPSLKRVVSRRNQGKPTSVIYTLMVIDRDNPVPENPIYSPFVEYLRINIGYQQTRGDEIIPYRTSPTEAGIVHRYVAIAFIQKNGWLDPTKLPLPLEPRAFPLQNFVKQCSLQNCFQSNKLSR